MESYQFFNDREAVEAYIEAEMYELMYEKNRLMENEERQHYTDQDRADMRKKIIDIEAYFEARRYKVVYNP